VQAPKPRTLASVASLLSTTRKYTSVWLHIQKILSGHLPEQARGVLWAHDASRQACIGSSLRCASQRSYLPVRQASCSIKRKLQLKNGCRNRPCSPSLEQQRSRHPHPPAVSSSCPRGKPRPVHRPPSAEQLPQQRRIGKGAVSRHGSSQSAQRQP
jgi:hypothetical protein